MPERTDHRDAVSLAAVASNMNVGVPNGSEGGEYTRGCVATWREYRQHKIAKMDTGKLEVAYECFATMSCYPTRGRAGS
jgi:hypothetical protein